MSSSLYLQVPLAVVMQWDLATRQRVLFEGFVLTGQADGKIWSCCSFSLVASHTWPFPAFRSCYCSSCPVLFISGVILERVGLRCITPIVWYTNILCIVLAVVLVWTCIVHKDSILVNMSQMTYCTYSRQLLIDTWQSHLMCGVLWLRRLLRLVWYHTCRLGKFFFFFFCGSHEPRKWNDYYFHSITVW